jgi:hypothetical protein
VIYAATTERSIAMVLLSIVVVAGRSMSSLTSGEANLRSVAKSNSLPTAGLYQMMKSLKEIV